MAAAAQETPIPDSVQVSKPSDFDSTLAAQTEASAGGVVFAIFVGARAEGTDASWCPDCVTAEPILAETMSRRAEGQGVMWCPVLRSEYKGNAAFPYRTHEKIKLTGVPTVIKFVAGEPKSSCVDGECWNKDAMNALLTA